MLELGKSLQAGGEVRRLAHGPALLRFVFTGGLSLRRRNTLQDSNVIGPLEAFWGPEFAPADDAPAAPIAS